MTRDVVLYYSHFYSPTVLREITRLRNELDSRYEVIAIGYCDAPDVLRGIDIVPAVAYTFSDLATLHYPQKVRQLQTGIRGNSDLAPIRFFLEHQDFDHYWIVEYDVRFSGNWSELFGDLSSSPADLLCTTVQSWAEHPNWPHWNSLVTGADSVPLERRVKGFMPFCRLSRRLLEACDARYRAGWGGHCEVLWPTLAAVEELRVEDIGGNGSFTPARRRGLYYKSTPCEWSQSPGTFVYRPCFTDDNLFGPNLLWHPVMEGYRLKPLELEAEPANLSTANGQTKLPQNATTEALRKENCELRAQNQALQCTIEGFRRSVSWRVTLPLRLARDLAIRFTSRILHRTNNTSVAP